MLASSHYRNVSKQTTRCILTLSNEFIFDLFLALDSICAFGVLVSKWSRLPPIQYQQSRSEMSIDNVCISVTNETSFLRETQMAGKGYALHHWVQMFLTGIQFRQFNNTLFNLFLYEVISDIDDDQLTNLSPPRNCMPPDVLLRESRQLIKVEAIICELSSQP
ncbi:hypothetical protein Tco_1540795 [Tanacetum coccineum]